MHGGQLHAQGFEGWPESAEKSVESAKLAEAVAKPARERLRLAIPKPQLVLDRRDGLIAELGQRGQHPAKDLARGELALPSVGPARSGEADLPARPPGQLVKGARVRPDDKVARARADPEPGVVADRRVGPVEREQEVGHDGAVAKRGLERRRAQRLSPNGSVDVGDAQQNELAALR